MKLYGCQEVLLHPDSELKAILEFICQQANSLTRISHKPVKKHQYSCQIAYFLVTSEH